MKAKIKRYLIGPGALDCNRGDQALLWEAIAILRKVNPDCEIAIMADVYDDPEDNQSRQSRKLGINVLPSLLPNPRRTSSQVKYEIIDSGWSLVKMKLRAVLDFVQMQFLLLLPRFDLLASVTLGSDRFRTYKYLRGCDALVIKGGGYIYAFAGMRWAYYIWFGLFSLMLAHGLRVKVLVFPNSFGPFETRWGRWLAHRVLSRCQLLSTREYQSQKIMNTIIPDKAALFPDMAFNLKARDRDWAEKELVSKGIDLEKKPLVGITMRPWRFPGSENPHERYSNYVTCFVKLIDYLQENGDTVILFAHVVGPHAHEDDRIAIADAKKQTAKPENVYIVDDDYDCRQVKAFYGLMDYMVCTRFHSAIFSIAQCIPCIAISYQGYKATGIMDEIGITDFTFGIDKIEAERLIKTFDAMIARRDEIKEKMSNYMSSCSDRLSEFNRVVAEKLKN